LKGTIIRRAVEFILFAAIAYVFFNLIVMYIAPFGAHPYPLGEYYILNTLAQVGAWNPVGAIVWDYRGYDTLGETSVLFVAVVGVVMLFRGLLSARDEHHR